MASSLRQAAPGPTKLLFHLIPRDREATLIVNCNPAHQVPFETGFVLGCFLDRPSSVQGRLLSFGRNAKHDIVLPAGPSGAKLSSPSNQSRVTKSTRSYQNYRNDHFFFYLAPSGELILRDLSPRLTALEIKDLNHREASLHALRGDPRQRVIPSNKTGIIITFGTSTSFELRWATSSNANQRDLAAHALAMHVSGMTITAPEQDTSQLKPPLHHSRHLRSQYTPSGGSSSAPERPLHKYTKLGAGGFGEVWKSVDLSSGELWAVKEIKSELSDDKWKHLFLKEVETLKQLKHENIVSFEGWQDFCFGGTSLLIFQLYDGNLNHLIFYDSRSRQQGRDQETGLQPTPGSAPTWYTQLVKQMLAALQYLHSSGIVHRDIKPDNIMYNKNQSRPDFFLGDFGLSMTQEALTRSGATTAGTVFYLAPELVNPSAASRFSDVWALGLTFARVLGFVKPQEGDLDAQYWAAKLRRHG
ncbi:kinase-like domain-containing protein, partial [Cladorrhinum sp. PSN332]